MPTRRDFIKHVGIGTSLLSIPGILGFAKNEGLPVRAIIHGPKYHWFGYYDKLQFDPSNRFVLGMQVDFEMRSPRNDDVIQLGYVDLANNDWIVNDTYPQRQTREQIPYLFQESTGRKIELGRFYEPVEYKGEWRCDLHPRSSNDGKTICIDSTHGRNGRQMYLVDLSPLKI